MMAEYELTKRDKKEIKALLETINLVLKKTNIKELSYKVVSGSVHFSPMITNVEITVGDKKIKKIFRNGIYTDKELFPPKKK